MKLGYAVNLLLIMISSLPKFVLLLIFTQQVISFQSPYDIKVSENQFPSEGLIKLSCSAKGDPLPKMQWFPKMDKNMVPDWHTNVGGMLIIPEPKAGLIYRFICNASNVHGYILSRVVFAGHAIIYENFENQPIDKTVDEKDTAMFECSPPVGIPTPRIYWVQFPLNSVSDNINDGQIIGRKGKGERFQLTEKGYLRIKLVNLGDAAMYRCVAENSAGIRLSRPAMLTVRKKPRFKEISTNQEVKEGDTAQFKCKLEGDFAVTWLRDSGLAVPSARSTIQGFSLTITDVKLSDAGTYICRVVGESTSSLEYHVNLIVHAPPTLSETPEDKTVMEGDDVEFKCVGKGYPVPKVYWELPAVSTLFPSDKKYERYRAYEDGRLLVLSVTMKDDGKYICNCHSSIDIIHASAQLKVTRRPLPPIIKIGPEDQFHRVGATATFRCEVSPDDSYMKPLVKWYVGNNMQRLSFSNRRFVKISRDTLQINDLKLSDAGNYTCQAETDTLTTSWHATLVVLRKDEIAPIEPTHDKIPPAPENLKVSDVTSNSLTLKWTFPGDSRDVTFRIEIAEAGTVTGWKVKQNKWKGDVIQINNLIPNKHYTFLVRAQNGRRLGLPSEPTRYIKTRNYPVFNDFSRVKPVPTNFGTIRVSKPALSSLSDSQVKISWEVQADNNLLNAIEGYKISYKPVSIRHCYYRTSKTSSYHCSLKEPNAPMRIETYISQMQKNLDDYYDYQSVKRTREPRLMSVINTEFTVVGKLKSFQCYEFKVNAFATSNNGEVATDRSESSYVWTYEDSPAEGPKSLWANWLNNSSFEITWKELAVSKWNGLLRGYRIYIFGNSSFYKQLEVNRSVHRIVVNNVNSNNSYTIHVAAQNCKSVGVRSPPFVLTKITQEKYSVLNQPWFIALMILCTIFWIGLLCFTIYVCCPCGKHRLSKKCHHIELVKKDHTENNSYTATMIPYGPDLTKGTDTILMNDLNKGKLMMNEMQLLQPSTNCPATTSVEPYASTSIINLGNLGPYASIHRGGHCLPNEAMHNLNNSYHHYYVDGGVAPLMAKVAAEPSLDDWRNPGRNVMNIGEMIPPPPESPPPASPYYAVDSLHTGPPSQGGYIMSRDPGFVSSRDGSTKNSSHGSDFSKAVSGVPRPCPTDSASSQDYDQTGQPLISSRPRIGNNSSGPSPSSNQSMQHSSKSGISVTNKEPVQSCSEEDDQDLLEEDNIDENNELHFQTMGHETFVNSEDLESSQVSGSEEDYFLENDISPGQPQYAGPPSPGYSTDSTYSSIPPAPHRPYPKSERKRQMKHYSTSVNQSGYRRAPNNNHLLPNRTQNIGCIDQPIV